MDLVKLGGSVITDKSKPRTARPEVIARLARELRHAPGPVVVVHGGGSFGHFGAREHDLAAGFKARGQLRGFAEVQKDMRVLNLQILEALLAAGIDAVALPGALVAQNQGGRIASLNPSPFMDYLDLGLTPMTFGDVVLDAALKFSICSGDDLMLLLGKGLGAKRALFVSDVDALLDAQGRPLAEVRASRPPPPALVRPTATDVTGGMGRKTEVMGALAKLGLEVLLLNGLREGRLADALEGKEVPGTRFRG